MRSHENRRLNEAVELVFKRKVEKKSEMNLERRLGMRDTGKKR